MFTIINKELFNFDVQSAKDQNTGKEFNKITITTSSKLVRYNKGDRNTFESPVREVITFASSEDPMKSNIVSFPDKTGCLADIKLNADIKEIENVPISLRVGENQKGYPTVQVRKLDDDRPNKANIYVLAIPFNGMIKPIPEDPTYHIYKGMISTSVKPFYIDGRKYKKVLYLVIEPHVKLFNEEHKYHTQEILVNVESYFKSKNDKNEEITVHDFYSLLIGKDYYDLGFDREEMDSVIELEYDNSNELWHTFKFDQKDKIDKPRAKNRDVFKKGGSGNRAGYRQGNMWITTNRHGFRKEVTLHDNSYNEHSKHNSDNNSDSDNYRKPSLDELIKESGIYDTCDSRDGRNNKKRNNRGSRNRKTY